LNALPTILLMGVSILLLPHCLANPIDQQVLNPSPELITSSHKSKLDKVRHALQKASIIPDIIDDFTPKCFVLPTYGHGEHAKSVHPGKKLKHSKTKRKPSLKVYCPNMKQTPGLTIALTDPDAPSKKDPKWSEMCHWIAPVAEAVGLRISGTDFEVDVNVDDIVKYKAPGPPEGTGYHRYVFVLLEGDNTNLTKPEDRQHWGTGKKEHGVRDWAKREGLEVIGGNYFREKQ